MLGRLDAVPGIAGHDPAFRRFVAQGIEVLGLAGEQRHHSPVLEEPAGLAFAHESRKISTEGHVEDRIRPGIDQRLSHRTGIDTAQCGRLLSDELDIGLSLFQQLLEGGCSRLPVLVVGVDQCPALAVELDRLGHQHRGLHVGRWAQAEGVSITVLPGDFVGQRFGGQKQHLALLCKVGDRKTNVRQEGPEHDNGALTRDEFFGDAHRIARIGVVVAGNHLNLLAQQATGCVDFFQRQLPALAVGLKKGRLRLVAVEFADSNLPEGGCTDEQGTGSQAEEDRIQAAKNGEFHRSGSVWRRAKTLTPAGAQASWFGQPWHSTLDWQYIGSPVAAAR